MAKKVVATLQSGDGRTYSNPKVIDKVIVRIVIPANSIERFQGFELKL